MSSLSSSLSGNDQPNAKKQKTQSIPLPSITGLEEYKFQDGESITKDGKFG